MTALLPSPELQFLDQNGFPYVGGTLTFFAPGTTSAKDTWQDRGQVTLNTNPIILDMAGRCVVFGAGDYRVQLRDRFGVLVFDQLTTSALNESAVSAFMLPVLGAANSATALGLLGVTAAIASAIAAVNLLPGPVGPTGPTGAVGHIGPTGPSGTAVAASISGSGNPGYWKDTASGFMHAFGTDSAGGDGTKTVTFAIPFVNTPAVNCTVSYNGINLVPRVSWANQNQFGVFIEDTDNHGGRGSQFDWQASGF